MEETEETRSMIEEIWQRKTAANSRFFNQSKYRMASFTWDEGTNSVLMCVGLTDYKDHVGTNLSEEASRFVAEKGDLRFAKMSQCIAVGAWVVTKGCSKNRNLFIYLFPFGVKKKIF